MKEELERMRNQLVAWARVVQTHDAQWDRERLARDIDHLNRLVELAKEGVDFTGLNLDQFGGTSCDQP